MSYRDAIKHGETNVGLGMVSGSTEEDRLEQENARLRDRLERAEGLLQSCKEPVWMVSELTTLSSPLRIDDSIVRRSERAKQLRGEIDAFLHGEDHG